MMVTTLPCGHPAAALAGGAVPYCTSCADVAATAARAERAYCRGLVRVEIAAWHRRAVRNPDRSQLCDAAIAALERVLEEMQ